MKQKKASADWYIAATHWLTATIGMVIFSVVLGIVLVLISQNPVVIGIGFIILYPLMMWLAVRYSANYLDKTYVIKNAHQIVLLSTIYIVIIDGGYRLLTLASKGLTLDDIGFLLAIIVFYFASKKYVKDNSLEAAAPIQAA